MSETKPTETDQAYEERNRLVALLASMFPSGIAQTDIPGWDAEWHGCVFIDFPWGQASWHFHSNHRHLFAHLPPYDKPWDGHTTDAKYAAIAGALAASSEVGHRRAMEKLQDEEGSLLLKSHFKAGEPVGAFWRYSTAHGDSDFYDNPIEAILAQPPEDK